MGPLNVSNFANQSKLHLLPLCLSASPPPVLSSAAAAVEGRRPPPALRGTHASCPSSSPPFSPRAGASPSLPRTPEPQTAATSPPPWPAQGSALAPLLSRAAAPGRSPHSIPLALSPFPCLETPERHRHGRRLPLSSPSSPLLRLFPP